MLLFYVDNTNRQLLLAQIKYLFVFKGIRSCITDSPLRLSVCDSVLRPFPWPFFTWKPKPFYIKEANPLFKLHAHEDACNYVIFLDIQKSLTQNQPIVFSAIPGCPPATNLPSYTTRARTSHNYDSNKYVFQQHIRTII